MTERLPVLWLAGPPGVGKSTIAWQVVARLKGFRTAYVDIDQLGICYPERTDDPGRNRIKARNFGAVSANFGAAGADCLVVSGVIEEQHVPAFVTQATTATILWCRLRLDWSALEDRAWARGWDQPQVDSLRPCADALDSSRFAQVVVDTTGGRVEEVVTQVVESLGAWPTNRTDGSLSSSHVQTNGSHSNNVRALWLVGPPAVGKSAVGWQVFQRTLASGEHAAYVDLVQIGHVSAAPPDDHGNHRLKASNLSALWDTYRAAGARWLVVTGPLEPDAAAIYRTAFGAGTELKVCRLTGSEATMAERIARRARGVSWAEPGDRLRNLSAAAVVSEAAAAMRLDHDLDREGVSDLTVDTDGLTVGEGADRVLALAPGWKALFPR